MSTERRELCVDGVPVSVEPQVFDILAFLIEQRERVVSRDELIETIWQGRIISDAALSSRIRDVRTVLGDTGAQQAFIKTLHGRGFRFVGNLLAAEDVAPVISSSTHDADRP